MKNGITIIQSAKKEINGQALGDNRDISAANYPSNKELKNEVRKGIASECEYYFTKLSSR